MVPCMITFHGRSHEPCRITRHKTHISFINIIFLKYNCQSLNLINEKSYVGKMADPFVSTMKENYTAIYHGKTNISRGKNECSCSFHWTHWVNVDHKRYSDAFCVSILFKDIVRYLIVLVKLHNDKSLIYFFTGEVINGTPNILPLIKSIIIGITI